MKKFLPAICGAFLAMFVMWLVLGAAAPAPLYRNQWTTNVPGQPVIGSFIYSNSVAGAETNFVIANSQGFLELNGGGRQLWKLYGWFGTDKAFDWNGSQSKLMTNGGAVLSLSDPTQVGLLVTGAAAQAGDLFNGNNSAGGTVFAVHPAGTIYSSVLSSNLATYTDSNTNLASASVAAITYAANTNTVNFGASTMPYFTTVITNDTVFTNRLQSAGKSVAIRLTGNITNSNLSFPAGWIFLGGGAPTSIASNKVAVLSLTAFGTDPTNITAVYSVQP
jgi:hypothetical protein